MTTTVLDPTGENEPAGFQLTERPAELSGLTVGLVDISKARGDVFLDRVESLLNERGVSTKRYIKPTFTKVAPVDLRHEISQHCQVVVQALAD